MARKSRPFAVKKTPYFLILPAILYYIFFWIRPVINGVITSFQSETGAFTLEYYTFILTEPVYRQALINTAIFSSTSVVIQYLLALFIALTLSKRFKGSKLMLFIAMMPMALPQTAVAVLWKTGLVTNGWVNSVINYVGLSDSQFPWLALQGAQSVLFLVLIDTWTVLPSVMIILVAGLQNFPVEMQEAGYVFGATRWQVLKDITIPILKPTIITSIILRLIASIQVWSIAVMLFGYGRMPFLVERVAYYVEVASRANDSIRVATATAVFVSAMIMVTAAIYLRVSKKNSILEVQ